MVTKSPTRILITGFGPFPGVAANISGPFANATGTALQSITASNTTQKIEVNIAVLDVAWATIADQLDTLYHRFAPNLAVHFGVCQTVSGLAIERTAHNECKFEPDQHQARPGQSLVDHCDQPVRTSLLPLPEIITQLKASSSCSVELSDDAGRYLCNAAYFHSLKRAEHQPQTCNAVFIHLPANLTPERAEWTELVSTATRFCILAYENANPDPAPL